MTIPGERSGADGILSHERSWSGLPKDIVHLFSKKLPDISDFIRFRAVCKSWQLSAPVTDPPPQLPWLLELRCGEHKEKDIIRFYCLSSGKVHTITCPGSHGAHLMGPACRYLLASKYYNQELYLLNPLTHDQIHVPFVSHFTGCPDYIGPDQIEGGDIAVISGIKINTDSWKDLPNMRTFWRSRADDWVCVGGVHGSCNAYYMGLYFSNDKETGITYVTDIATKKLAYQVAPPEGTNLFRDSTFMVISGGKILRLLMNYKAEPCHFDIHYLYFGDGEGKPCWVKITDISDQMLFLQCSRGLSFCASNFVGFKGNCIYFMKDLKYISRYDIGDATTEVLPCPFDLVNAWFVPSLV